MNIAHLITIFASLAGLFLSFYIFIKKRTGQVLVCPLKADCSSVIHSQYSQFFGIPLELFGVGYYGAIATLYIVISGYKQVYTPSVALFLISASAAAFLFSLYLTFIQGFSLKQWCTWCLCSALLSTTIFFLAIGFSEYSFYSLLVSHRWAIVILHILAMAWGLGAATLSDIFFLRFLKDLKISESEQSILHVFSQFIWCALAFIIITGTLLYLPDASVYGASAKFLAKMTIVAVIVINGALLNLLVAPKLMDISFGKQHDHVPGELHAVRKLAFVLGAISVVSWYSAFLLGALRNMPFDYATTMLVYCATVLVAIGGALVVERHMIGRE